MFVLNKDKYMLNMNTRTEPIEADPVHKEEGISKHESHMPLPILVENSRVSSIYQPFVVKRTGFGLSHSQKVAFLGELEYVH